MDLEAQAKAYAEADFAAPHDLFVAKFREAFPAFVSGRVLDLGCGPADVTVRFARAFPGSRLTAVDAAECMLKYARKRLLEEHLEGVIDLIKAYLPDVSGLPQDFDCVISNSLLHHMRDPLDLWRTIRQGGRAGAPVFVMDLMRPDSAANVESLVQTYAQNEPEILKKDFRNSLFSAYHTAEVEQQLQFSRLNHFTVEPISDRHLMVWGSLP